MKGTLHRCERCLGPLQICVQGRILETRKLCRFCWWAILTAHYWTSPLIAYKRRK